MNARPHARRTENRLQDHAQPAGHAVSDARRSREARAAAGSRSGRRRRSTRRSARRRAGRPRFVLHDGPPYANDDIHIGHARQQDPEGHRRQEQDAGGLRRAVRAGLGLPRHADRGADREDARQAPPGRGDAAARARLRDRADRAAEGATSSASACSATGIIRTRRWPSGTRPTRSARSASILEKGYLYRGLKPVNWCFDCGSALAEAEVEYEDRAGHRDRRRVPDRRCRSRASSPRRSALARAAGRPGRGRDLDDDAVDDPGEPGAQRHTRTSRTRSSRRRAATSSSRRTWWRRASRAYKLEGKVVATAKGAALERIALPASVLRPRVARLSRRVRDARAGHRHRPPSPAYGVEDFQSCRRYGMKDDEILSPVQGRRHVRRPPAVLRRR